MKNNFPQMTVSILNSDLLEIKKTLKILDNCGIKFLHLDIMDGNFVPNLTFGPLMIDSIRKNTEFILDTHLMVNCPQKTLQQYIDCGSDIITIHYESLKKSDIINLIRSIKKQNRLAGISIKPKTSPLKILEYMKYIDLVLIMTVEPGFGGQKIIKECLSKIDFFRIYKKEKKLNFIISADGGINEKNVCEIVSRGCDLPVIGSAIFSKKDIKSKIKYFKTLIK